MSFLLVWLYAWLVGGLPAQNVASAETLLRRATQEGTPLVDRIASVDMTGSWRVKGSFDAASVAKGAEQRVNLECTFAQRGDNLTGTCGPSAGPEGVAVAGTVHDQSIEWHFDIALNKTAKKQMVTFTGTMADGGLTGTFAIGELRGDFTAERD